MKAHPPHNLDGAPQIENKEHNCFVVHFLQATENDEEDEIPSNHLEKHYYFNQFPSGLNHQFHGFDPTCIRVGTTLVRTKPKAALRTSTDARIWQKNITSDTVWNVSYRESETTATWLVFQGS